MFSMIYIDEKRRVKLYPKGGAQPEIYVDGHGWVIDDEDTRYPEELKALARAADEAARRLKYGRGKA